MIECFSKTTMYVRDFVFGKVILRLIFLTLTLTELRIIAMTMRWEFSFLSFFAHHLFFPCVVLLHAENPSSSFLIFGVQFVHIYWCTSTSPSSPSSLHCFFSCCAKNLLCENFAFSPKNAFLKTRVSVKIMNENMI